MTEMLYDILKSRIGRAKRFQKLNNAQNRFNSIKNLRQFQTQFFVPNLKEQGMNTKKNVRVWEDAIIQFSKVLRTHLSSLKRVTSYIPTTPKIFLYRKLTGFYSNKVTQYIDMLVEICIYIDANIEESIIRVFVTIGNKIAHI